MRSILSTISNKKIKSLGKAQGWTRTVRNVGSATKM